MRLLGRLLHFFTRQIIPLLPGWSRQRVRVLVCDDKGRTLLVKSWFSRQQWTMPGGGVEEGESYEEACAREVYEETGLTIDPNKLVFLTSRYSSELRAELLVYKVKTVQTQLPLLKFPHNLEISDRAWYPVRHLPAGTSELTTDAARIAF